MAISLSVRRDNRLLHAALGILAAMLTLNPAAVHAQTLPSALDRILGPSAFGGPLALARIDVHAVRLLSATAGVPMGFESAWDSPIEDAPPAPKPILLTGLTLRAALQQLVSLDPRYDWRDLDGVIVIRPHTLWGGEASPLQREVGPIYLRFTRAELAIGLVGQLLGDMSNTLSTWDSPEFTLDFPGGTVLDLLNAIVRGRDELYWTFTRCIFERADPACHFSVSLSNIGGGSGRRVAADAAPHGGTGPIDLSRFEMAPREVRGQVPFLDRIVGVGPGPRSTFRDVPGSRADPGGNPPILHAVWYDELLDIVRAKGGPMGFEMLESPGRSLARGIDMTGSTVAQVLTEATKIDPRYEWREVDGVAVLRPVESWTQPTGVLATRVPAQRFEGTVGAAMQRLRTLTGWPPANVDAGADTRTFPVDAPAGTMFDLLNAIARAHGEMIWTVRRANLHEQRLGIQYRIDLFTPDNAGSLNFTWPFIPPDEFFRRSRARP